MCPARKIIKQWQYYVNGLTDNKVASQRLCRNPFPGQPTIFLYYPISIFFSREFVRVHKDSPILYSSACLPRNSRKIHGDCYTDTAHVLRRSGNTTLP